MLIDIEPFNNTKNGVICVVLKSINKYRKISPHRHNYMFLRKPPPHKNMTAIFYSSKK